MPTSLKIIIAVGALLLVVGAGWIGFHLPLPSRSSHFTPPQPRDSSAVSIRADAVAPRPSSVAASELARLDTRLVDLERELQSTLATVAQHKLLAQAYAADLSDHAASSAGTGASIFKDIQEAGLFIAAINQKSVAYARLAEKHPSPPPGSPETAEVDRLLKEITRDAAAVVQDPLFMGALTSADPVRNALAQAAYVGPSLGLDATEQALLTARLTQAYREGHDRKLSGKNRPSGDDSAWRTGREELNARTVADIKSRLTPGQREVYSLLNYDDLIFNFSIGAAKK